MKLLFTERAIISLQECLDFFPPNMAAEKVNEIRDKILAKAEMLLDNPKIGQLEEYLDHLGQAHRRVIEGNYKIIYKVTDDAIIVTDVFDTRQNPSKMKE